LDSYPTQNMACYNAAFQTRFIASPWGTPKKGVTKIGHIAETRIITGRIGLSLEFAKFSLETFYYQSNTHFIVNQKRNKKSCDKCRFQNRLYNFIFRI